MRDPKKNWHWTLKNKPDRQQFARFRKSQKLLCHSTLTHSIAGTNRSIHCTARTRVFQRARQTDYLIQINELWFKSWRKKINLDHSYWRQIIIILHAPLTVKGVCHEIFDLLFFSWFEPIWAPDKHAKVLNWFLILPRYLITKFDSVVCMTLRSQNVRQSKSKIFSSNLFFHVRCIYP